jgi:hypothetical protein
MEKWWSQEVQEVENTIHREVHNLGQKYKMTSFLPRYLSHKQKIQNDIGMMSWG